MQPSLLIPPIEVDAPRLLAWWSYLVPNPGPVLGLSPFGDWFLEQPGGTVWRLDLLEGRFEQIAPSVEAFWASLGTPVGEDDWLQAGTVLALQRMGHVRAPGQCYTYVVHPRLGASVDAANVRLNDIGAWQIICSQLHPQLDALPEGASITKVNCDAEGRISLEWRPSS